MILRMILKMIPRMICKLSANDAANNLATVCYDCTFCMSANVANRWLMDVQLVTNIAKEFLPGCYLVVVLDRVRKIFEASHQ